METCRSCPGDEDRPHRRALLLAYLTVGYNVLEGLVSILAGTLAGSIALVGFGLDSFVESLSGGVIVWRFRQHGRLSPEEEAGIEAKAVGLIGWTFLILAAYVAYESVKKILLHEVPDKSLLGILIAAVSLVAMPLLFLAKYRTAKVLGSRSLMADSRQTLACAFLSLALLAGLGLNYLWGLWWADPAVGLLVVFYLLREGREALREKKLCAC